VDGHRAGNNVKEKESSIMRRPHFEVRADNPGQSARDAERYTWRDAVTSSGRSRFSPHWHTTIRESDVSTKQCATFEKTRCRAWKRYPDRSDSPPLPRRLVCLVRPRPTDALPWLLRPLSRLRRVAKCHGEARRSRVRRPLRD